ncbi:MAG: hypothetical protein AAGJ38_02260, partial [Planctomycetota bacterium]
RGDWQNAEGFGSAVVDQEELNRVLSNWGGAASPNFSGLAVPEPAVMGVALVGMASVMRRMRPRG